MSHHVESMFAVGSEPWHGLGVLLDAAPESTAEALRLAGLDWQIGLERLQLPDGTQVDRHAVLRTSDRSVLGVVGLDWTPIQNVEAFKPFDPFLQVGAATIESAGSLKGGRRVWMLAKLARPDSVIVPQSDDRVAKYLLVAVGHDGTLSFSIGYSPTRVVCWNTLSIALQAGESSFVKVRHSRNASDAIDAITAKIAEIDARFEDTANVFRALASVQIKSAAQLRAYVDAVFPPAKKLEATPATVDGAELLGGLLAKPHVSTLPSPLSPEGGDMLAETKSRVFEEIAHLFEHGRGNDMAGVKGTGWAAYNAVTEYNTWERGRSIDNRMDNVWLSQSGPVARALPAAVAQFLPS